MYPCRLGRSLAVPDVICLDCIARQHDDFYYLPQASLDSLADASRPFTLEIHPPGKCNMPDAILVFAGLSAERVRAAGLLAVPGSTQWPRALEQPSYAVNVRFITSGDLIFQEDRQSIPGLPRRPVAKQYAKRETIEPWTSRKKARVDAATTAGTSQAPLDEDTIDVDVHSDVVPPSTPAPKPTNCAVPLLKCTLFDRLARCGNSEAEVMPTLPEAEAALRVYCTALANDVAGDRRAAESVFDDMSAEQQLLGHCLFQRTLAPRLEWMMAERMREADRRLLVVHAKAQAAARPREQLREVLAKLISGATSPVRGVLRAFPRGGPCDAMLQKLTDFYHEQQDVAYACRWEEATDVVGHRGCLLAAGLAYMDNRTAITLCVAKAADTDVVRMFVVQEPQRTRTCRIMDSGGPFHWVIEGWLDVLESGLETALRPHVGRFQVINASDLDLVLTRGPICAAFLHDTLVYKKHLRHDDRINMLRLLLDCGLDREHAIAFIWNRLSKEAQESWPRKQYLALIKSYCTDKRSGQLSMPATARCVYLSKNREGVGCPWATKQWSQLQGALQEQGVAVPDIEDLGRLHAAGSWGRCCMKHYETMYRFNGATDKMMRPEKYALNRPQTFLAGLFPGQK